MNEDLEAMDGLCAKIIEQRDRIEALEAALRMVIDNVETGSYESTGEAIKKARAVLEQK